MKVSPDLRVAWVYYTVLGEEKARAGTRAALRSAAPHLRRELGRQVRLKVTPELRFEEDEMLATGRADRPSPAAGPAGGGAGWTLTGSTRAAAVLRDAPVVAIACHVNPDADALGLDARASRTTWWRVARG